MKIKKLVLGNMGTNCYVLGEKNVAVVDPGADSEKIIAFLEREGMKADKILVTHGHFDHVCALKALKEATGAKVYMHRDDVTMLGSMEKSLGFMMNETPEACEIDVLLKGGEEIEVEGEKIKVMSTPGHSQGSVSYIGTGFVCSGDLIFRESIGRYDFGGGYCMVMASVKRLLNALEPDWVILPGHGMETTRKYEEENNPYLNN
ncbi:MAG: MBL fold metallo-hydrolase [Clostridia bacterium]|nr:MBL fold metallo-hydrolase [Clostridia bacterium]